MRRFIFIVLWMIGWPFAAYATTRTTADCSNAEFASKISASSSGDTVLGPGGTDTGGGTRVDIPSTKGITVDGGGCSINWGFGLTTNASANTRITNFTFTKNGDNTGPNASFKTLGTSLTNARWRLDHCTFSQSGSNVIELGPEPGLFDHNSITGATSADEFIHLTAWGAEDETGWTTAMPSAGNTRAQGTDEAVIFEDNTISASSESNGNASFMEGFYGTRAVFRYNHFKYWKLDYHGGGNHTGPPWTNIGGRWIESYKNDFEKTSAGNQGGYAHNMRAGSGIIFGNTKSGSGDSGTNGFCEEGNSAYPNRYQIGRGTAQALDPEYVWQNDQTNAVNACEADISHNPNTVAFNRDVYTDIDSASCTAGGACTSGVGVGTTLPTTCTTGVAFWKTDAGGNWDTTHGGANDGALYKCTSTDTFTLYYTPYTYPDPLQGGSVETQSPAVLIPMRMILMILLMLSSIAVPALFQDSPPHVERVFHQ